MDIDVTIDKLRLDRECVKLPSAYLQAAHAAADAKQAADESKAELDVLEAELSKMIRDSPAKYGIEKVTEAAVSAAVTLNKQRINCYKKLVEARHAYEVAQALVWAMEHKKRALTLLVDLHGMGYFGEVRPSGKVRRREREE